MDKGVQCHASIACLEGPGIGSAAGASQMRAREHEITKKNRQQLSDSTKETKNGGRVSRSAATLL